MSEVFDSKNRRSTKQLAEKVVFRIFMESVAMSKSEATKEVALLQAAIAERIASGLNFKSMEQEISLWRKENDPSTGS